MTIRIEKSADQTSSTEKKLAEKMEKKITSLPPRIPNQHRKIKRSTSAYMRSSTARAILNDRKIYNNSSFYYSESSDSSCSDEESNGMKSPLRSVVLDSMRSSKIRRTNSFAGESLKISNEISLQKLIKNSKSENDLNISVLNTPGSRSSLVMGTQMLAFKKENNIEKAERMKTVQSEDEKKSFNFPRTLNTSRKSSSNLETYDNVPQRRCLKLKTDGKTNQNEKSQRRVSFSMPEKDSTRPRVRLSYVEAICNSPSDLRENNILAAKRHSWAAGDKNEKAKNKDDQNELKTSLSQSAKLIRSTLKVNLSRSRPLSQSLGSYDVIYQNLFRPFKRYPPVRRFSWSSNSSESLRENGSKKYLKKLHRNSLAGPDVTDVGRSKIRMGTGTLSISLPLPESIQHVNAYTSSNQLSDRPDFICQTSKSLENSPDLADLIPSKR